MTTPRYNPVRSAAALLVLLALSFAPQEATSADQTEISVEVDPSVVSIGESFQYKLLVRVQGNRKIEVDGRPDFGSAFQVHGRSSAPSLVLRNGNVRRSRRVTYRLRAVETGSFEIRAPTIRVGSETRTPETVTVKVVADGDAQRKERSDEESTTEDEGPIRLEYEIEPGRRPYLGQQLTLTYRLLIDPELVSARPRSTDEPNLDDFWIEDLSRDRAGRSGMTRVGDRYMKVTILRSYALFPLETGSVTIDPMELDVQIGGLLGRDRKRHVRSEPVELNVRPLPEGAPPGFYEGNVGTWSFRVRTEAETARVGEPITLRMIAQGNGNVSRLELPTLESTAAYQVTDRDTEVEKEVEKTRVTGRKTATYTLVPRKRGRLEIPALTFSYFEPESAKYLTIESEPLDIDVREGSGDVSVAKARAKRDQPGPETSDEPTASARILADMAGPIHDRDAVAGAPSFTERTAFFVGSGLPLFGLVLLLAAPGIARRWREGTETSDADDSLEDVRTLQQKAESRPEEAPATIQRALSGYLKATLDVPAGEATSSDVRHRLRDRDLSDDLVDELTSVLEWCEEQRFSPEAELEAATAEEMARRAAELVERIEETERRDGTDAPLGVGLAIIGATLACSGLLSPVDSMARTPETAETPFDRAVALQEAGEWEKAAQQWRDVRENGTLGTAGAYNLGTTLAQLGKLGGARLHLERAGRAAPAHPKIATNVEKVRELVDLERARRAGLASLPSSAEPGLGWWRLATAVGDRTLGLALVLALWIAFIGALARRWWEPSRARTVGTVALVVGLLGFAGVSATWGGCARLEQTVRPVVVTSEETVEAYVGPSDHASSANAQLPLVPGTMLRVDRSRDGWLKVRTDEETSVWIDGAGVTRL